MKKLFLLIVFCGLSLNLSANIYNTKVEKVVCSPSDFAKISNGDSGLLKELISQKSAHLLFFPVPLNQQTSFVKQSNIPIVNSSITGSSSGADKKRYTYATAVIGTKLNIHLEQNENASNRFNAVLSFNYDDVAGSIPADAPCSIISQVSIKTSLTVELDRPRVFASYDMSESFPANGESESSVCLFIITVSLDK